MSMKTLRLSGVFADETPDLLRLCTALIPIAALSDGEVWALDLSEVESIGAYASVGLVVSIFMRLQGGSGLISN